MGRILDLLLRKNPAAERAAEEGVFSYGATKELPDAAGGEGVSSFNSFLSYNGRERTRGGLNTLDNERVRYVKSQVVINPSRGDIPSVSYEKNERNEKTPTIVSPTAWAPAAEPPPDEPCDARRGRIEERDGRSLHFCRTCGRWGSFGFGVTKDSPGRWYCRDHRPQE